MHLEKMKALEVLFHISETTLSEITVWWIIINCIFISPQSLIVNKNCLEVISTRDSVCSELQIYGPVKELDSRCFREAGFDHFFCNACFLQNVHSI